MAKNIKSTTIPQKLAPYISIIPKIQIETTQVQKDPESSMNQNEYTKFNNDSKYIKHNTIYQPNIHTSNNFPSNDINHKIESIHPDNASICLAPNISHPLPQKHEIIPQFPKSQKTIINPLNSNELLINSPNLPNRSNIDIILNNNISDERNQVDHIHSNANINYGNQKKNDIIITKSNNNIPHQIISTKNLINPNLMISNNNQNMNNNNLNINNIDNIMISGNTNMNFNNNTNNLNIDNQHSILSNQNRNEREIKPNINEGTTMNSNKIISSSLPIHNQNNDALMKGAQSGNNQKPSTAKNKKSPAYRKVMWTHAEDQLLIKTISRHGTNNWELVSNEVAGRTRKQCRERWAGILNPSLTKQPWTTEEDETLKMLHAQYGNKWAMIAAQMKGRSTIALRNRWSFHMRHAYREVKQAPFRYIIENRNGEYNNDSNNLNINLNQQQIPPVIQPQQQAQQPQQMPIQNQNQLQLIPPIQVVPNPYPQVQQQNICGVFPVINQPQQQQQKQIYQPNQISMQNIPQYQQIQIIQQPYEQPQQTQLVNTLINVVELPNNSVNNPPNYC